MSRFGQAFSNLKDSFWEPHLPYGANAAQKSIEDTHKISDPRERVSAILSVLDTAMTEKGADKAQSDLFQGLKLLSYRGALPFDEQGGGAPCIYQAIAARSKYPPEYARMVGALCVNQGVEAVSQSAQKKWAEKSYYARYADIIAQEPAVLDAEAEGSKKNCILLQGPAHWFCRENN